MARNILPILLGILAPLATGAWLLGRPAPTRNHSVNSALPNPVPSFARAFLGFAASTALLSTAMVLLAAL